MTSPSEPDLSAFASLAHELAITLARVVGDLAIVVDAQGVILAVEEGASVPVAGCASWVGRRWADTVCAGSQAKLSALLADVDRSGAVTHGRELMHPLPQGGQVPVAWSAIRLGPLGPVLAVGRDLGAVTAMQQRFVEVQQEMERHYWRYRQVQSRYKQLHQVAHDAVMVLDAASLMVLQANEACAEVTGRTLAEMLHQPLTDGLAEGLRSDVLELLVAVRSGGRAVARRGLGGDAGKLWEMAAAPLSVEGRRQLLMRVREGGVEREADEAVALSRMASFVESTADALVITKADGTVRLAGPAFMALAGQTDEGTLRSRTLAEWVGAGDGTWEALMAQVRRVGMVSGQPMTAVGAAGAGGERRRVVVSAALLAEAEPAGIGWVIQPGDSAG
ncbi:PAS domain-containing protein [Roseateles terrae]|uniref:Transcriptional regulator PpsR n=1 Tax=Roseateles terrae TaxID=431060 RepID=A0ABR6GUI8_9BURK|nr:PAS domain-containing protein [Roseateles terrae]MBB3195783.1 transcriptional regulator PpsR [Roseateles terrae]